MYSYQCTHCGNVMREYCHSKAEDFATRRHATTIVCENALCIQRNKHFRKPVATHEVHSVEVIG